MLKIHRMSASVSRLTILSAFLITTTAVGGSTIARASDSVGEWKVIDAEVSKDITVTSETVNGVEVEVIRLATGEAFVIPAAVEDASVVNSGLTAAEFAVAREEARDALEQTLRGVMSPDFNGEIVVSSEGAATVQAPASLDLKKTRFAKVKSFLRHPLSATKTWFNGYVANYQVAAFSREASVAKNTLTAWRTFWKFFFIETVRAGIDYKRNMVRDSSRFTQYGFSVDLKIEPQVFLGKFNPTAKVKQLSHSFSLSLEISWNAKTKKVFLRKRFRREKGVGGLGLPAIKAEAKFFQSDDHEKSYKGKSWYPVSIPVVSFVLDSSEHYYAQGLTVGLNGSDLIPLSFLTNTFTDFVQSQDSIEASEIPKMTSEALAKSPLRFRAPRQMTCSALFG